MIDPTQALAGLLVGTIVGLTGVGGGSLMTPILVLVFQVPPVTAVGTDLLHAAVTKACGTWVHSRHRRVDWRIVVLLGSGSVPAAFITLLLVHRLSAPGSSRLVTLTLGVALLLTAGALILSLLRNLRRRTVALKVGPAVAGGSARALRTGMTVGAGALLGVLVSISSVGAGALGIVALYLLYPRLTTARIVAVDIAHAVPLTLVAGLGHWMFGSVDARLLVSLLVGSLPGIYFGSHLAGRVPEALLRTVLAATLVLAGYRLLSL
ncbi:MAG TPA: sulfite exporter TauE/SafE family protein [Steroidobacteraceae bacterium]|nr:sulfite exporter TauE/SafE family protein [Steroidobacteraceae bacterium]